MKRALTFWAIITAVLLGGLYARAVNHPYCNPPVITTSPASQTVCQGQPAVLTVVASGDAPLTYQWQKYNGSTWVALNDGGTVSGAATHTLTISSVGSTDAGSYHVYIVNSCDTNTSATATLALSGTPPAISGLPNTTLSYVRGGAAKLITQDGTASFAGTVNNGDSLKVAFTDSYMLPGDQLAIRDQGPGSGNISLSGSNIGYGPAPATVIGTFSGGVSQQPLVVTFNGNGTQAAVNALLNNLTYSFDPSQCMLPTKVRSLELTIADSATTCFNPAAARPLSVSCPQGIDAVVIIDRTTSMSTSTDASIGAATVTRLQAATNAAKVFLSKLNFPTDKVGLLTFYGDASSANNPNKVSTNPYMSSDSSYLTQRIETINNSTTGGGTTYDHALDAVLSTDYLGQPVANRQRLVIFLTDGSISPTIRTVAAATTAAQNSATAIKNTTSDGIPSIRLVTIGLGSDIVNLPDTAPAKTLLKSMASSSADCHFNSGNSLDQVFLDIASSVCRGDQPPYVKFHRPAPLNYVDGDSATLLDPNFELLDPDSSNLNGGYLTVSLTAGAEAQDRLEISNQGTGTGQIGVSGTTVSYQSQTIGTINGSGGQGTTPLTVTFTTANATAAAAQALMRAVTYRSLSDSPSTTSRTVQVVANDGANSQNCNSGLSLPTTMTINDAQINDAPVIQFVDTTPLYYTENEPAKILAPNGTVTDADSADLNTGKLTVDFSANGQSQDQLGISNQGTSAGQIGVSGATVSYGVTTIGTITTGPGSTKLVVTFNASATPAAAQALFRRVTYWNSSENPSTLVRTVRAGISDGDGAVSAATTRTVSVSSVDDPPVIQFVDTTLNYNGGDTATILAPDATVTDVDSANFNTGTLTVDFSANGQPEDQLGISHQGTSTGQIGVSGATVSYSGTTIGTITTGPGTATLVVTFNSSATVAAAQALLRAVTYWNSADNPSTLVRTVRAVQTDGVVGGTSAPTTMNVTVMPGNAPPVIQFVDTALTYTANTPATILAPNGTVTDVDSADFNTGTLTVDIPANGQAEDHVGISHQGTSAGQIGVSGANVSYGGANIGTFAGGAGTTPLVVALNASATPAAVQALLRRVTYWITSDNPSTLARTVRAVLTDGDGGTSAPTTMTVYVLAGSPVNAGPDQTVWLEDGVDLAGFPVTAGAGTTLAWSVVSGPGPVNFGSVVAGNTHSGFGLAGVYVLRLTLTRGSTAYTDDVTIVVRQNKAPTVDAGPDRILAMPTSALNIVGTATDDWTAPGQLTYQWSLVSGPSIPTPPPGATLALVGNLSAGQYVFKFEVTDERGAVGRDFMTNFVVDARGRTWTRNADFEEGYMVNVDYDQIPDSLTLSARGTSSRISGLFSRGIDHGPGGWLARIDTTTGQTIGWHPIGGYEYCNTWDFHPDVIPGGGVQLPNGDTLVVVDAGFAANGGYAPAILRFGTVMGGTRVNASGQPDQTVAGEYLAPPFKYSTCVDRNQDGKLKSSRGLDQAFSWCVTPPAGDLATIAEEAAMLLTAQDETLVQFHLLRCPPPNQNTMAVDWVTGITLDSLGNIWVSGVVDSDSSVRLLRLDPNTLLVTEVVDPGMWTYPQFSSWPIVQAGPNDKLYVDGLDAPNNWGAITANTLPRNAVRASGPALRWDWHYDYRFPPFAINPRNGSIWYLSDDDGTKAVRLNPTVSPWSSLQFSHGLPSGVLAPVTIDANDDVWLAPKFILGGSFPFPAITHLADSGQQIGIIQIPCTDSEPESLTVDGRGQLWLSGEDPGSNPPRSKLIRIDPKRGPVSPLVGRPVGVVDRVFVGPTRAGDPESDNILLGDASQQFDRATGTWTAVHDGGSGTTGWGSVSWHATTASGSSIKVEARAAGTQLALAGQPWVTIAATGDSLGASGRWIEVRVTFTRGTGNVTPILNDLTVLPTGAANVTLPVCGQIAVDDAFSTSTYSTPTTTALLTNIENRTVQFRVFLYGNTDKEHPNQSFTLARGQGTTLISGAYSVLEYDPHSTWNHDLTVLPGSFVVWNGSDYFPLGEAEFDVLANDKNITDRVIESVDKPRHGTTRIYGTLIGYTPDPGFWGEDRFVYVVSAPGGIVDRGLVKVNVSPSPAPPSGNPQPDPGTGPGTGTSATYTSFTNAYGPANIAGDCKGSAPVNPPQAIRDVLFVRSRNSADTTEYPIDVMANDMPAGQIALVDDFPRPTGFGHVRKYGNLLLYQPSVGAYGTDSFSYRITDRLGAEASGTVVVHVTPVLPPTVTLSVSSSSPQSGATATLTAITSPQNVDTSLLTIDVWNGLLGMNLFDTQAGTLPSQVTPGIVRVEFFAGTRKVGEMFPTLPPLPPTGNTWTFAWQGVPSGTYLLTAVATDELGSQGVSTPVTLQINSSNPANHKPTATITGFQTAVAPADIDTIPADSVVLFRRQAVRTGRPTVVGVAIDADNSDHLSCQVLLYRADGTYVANVTSTGNANKQLPYPGGVNGGNLDTIDLTGFANGSYQLELHVYDGIDETVSARFPFVLRTGLKLGQFRFEEQDVISATQGLPLTITRAYDSSKLWDGDFGYGWTFLMNDLDVEINEDRAEVVDAFTDDSFSMRVGGGWDVTLNLPEGKRTTFLFNISSAGAEIPYGQRITWTAEPGVAAKLSTPSPGSPTDFGDNLILTLPNLYYFQAGGPACPIENFDIPKLLLTLQDGTTYTIERENLGGHDVEVDAGHYIYTHAYGKPHLTRIDKSNGEALIIGPSGVDHYVGVVNGAGGQRTRSLRFERGVGNRITAVREDSSAVAVPLVRYEYDGSGNLVRVHKLVSPQNQSYETTTYKYDQPQTPHYITSILDARGIEVAISKYNADGKIQSITDARGQITSFTYDYDPTHFATAPATATGYGTRVARESITFAPVTGVSSTAIHEADARGNIIYSKDPLGFETWSKCGARPDLVGTTDPEAGAWLLLEQQYTVTEQENCSSVSRTYVKNWGYGRQNDTSDTPAQRLAVTDITDTHVLGQSGSLRTTHYVYNALGQVTQTFDPRHPSTGSTYQETVYGVTQTSPTYGQALFQYFHNAATGANPQTPSGGQQLSAQTYYPDTGTFQGMLWYSLDAQGAVTVNDYYGSGDTGGRIGDLKAVTVYPAGTLSSGFGTVQYLSKTTFTYDNLGNRLTETRWCRTRNTLTGTPTGGETSSTTTYTYDVKGRVTSTVDATGASSETTYDSLGKTASSTDRYNATTRYHYDRTGQTSLTEYPDGTVSYQATKYQDGGTGVGLLKFTVTEDRHLPFGPTEMATGTRTVSDSVGRVIRSERVKDLVISVTVAGEVCDTTYSSCTLVASTLTEYLADGRVRRTAMDIDLNEAISSGDPVTSYEYSADGLTRTTFVPDAQDGSDVIHTRVIEIHDLAGNLTSSQTKSFKNSNTTAETQRPVTVNLYDDLDRVKETWAYADESLSSGTRTSKSLYDWSNRAWLQVDGDNHGKAMIYNDAGQLEWVVTDVDPAVSLPTTPYTTVADWVNWAKHGRASCDATATHYISDELGRQVAQVDGNNHATHYGYDALDRRSSRYLPGAGSLSDGESWFYDWDLAGNQTANGLKRPNAVKHVDFKGQGLITVYDAASRLSQKKRASDGAVLVTCEYTATGRRSRMVDNQNNALAASRVTRYVYDDQQRLLIQNMPEGTLSYAYDTAGNLRSVSAQKGYTFPAAPPYTVSTVTALGTDPNPSGASMTYNYDARQRLTKVNNDGSNADAAYSYDPVGNQATVTCRNLVQTAYTYNKLNQLRWMRSYKTSTPATTLASFDYDDADPNDGITWPSSGANSRVLAVSGLRRGVREVLPAAGASRLVAYNYDNLNRLTREALYTGAWATESGYAQYNGTPGYDAVGNRGARTVSGFTGLPNGTLTYSPYTANDWLGAIQSGKVGASFDANGNTLQFDLDASGTADVNTPDQYDLENRLVTATRGGNTINLVYDGDGNRVNKSIGATTTYYLVAEVNPTGYAQVLEERSATTGAPTVKYVYGLGLVSQTRGGATTYYGYDGHGSVRYLTDSSGVVSDTYTYDAFGIQIQSSGSTANLYQYTGEQRDADLGMYYLRARYFNPQAGRFWTADSFEGNREDPLSLHRYLYAHADPVNMTDQTGHESQKTIMGKQVHKKLGEDFTRGAIKIRFSGPSIATIGKKIGLPIPDRIEVLFPDLLDAGRKEVYEIKPLTPYGLATGFFQALGYVSLLNTIDPSGGWHLGNTWSPPSFLILPPTSGSAGGVAYISPPVGGVIFYEAVTIQQIAKRGNRTVRSSQQSQLQQQMGIATILSTMGGF